MILLGSLVNGGAIVLGAALGLLFKKMLPERMRSTLLHATSLCSLGIAIPGLIGNDGNALVPILSLVVGTLIGELLNIDGAMTRLGESLQKRLSGHGSVTEGFVTASLVFAIGAMAVMGALQSGLQNEHSILFAKSIIDGVAAVVFASTLGIGVAFSGITVFAVEGIMALLSSLIAPYLSDMVVTQITFTGSLLILAISFNVMGITKIKVLNMVPALILPIFLCMILK